MTSVGKLISPYITKLGFKLEEYPRKEVYSQVNVNLIIMKCKLIDDLGCARIYELSEPIWVGKSDLSGEVDIQKILLDDNNRVRDNELKLLLDLEIRKGCRHVVVSDCTYFIERLAFPAVIVNFKGQSQRAMSLRDIAGKHTSSIRGGDPDQVYPDVVYLRFLCMLNNLNWEGLS